MFCISYLTVKLSVILVNENKPRAFYDYKPSHLILRKSFVNILLFVTKVFSHKASNILE